MRQKHQTSWKRIIIATVALTLVALAVGSGSAAAHNPACHQVAGPDGPHYDDDDTTGSDTAYERNKNLGGDAPNDNAADSCDVGNSQSPHSDSPHSDN